MADYEQLPGELNIKTSISDDLSILLDFDIDLTGYTFTANMLKAGTETATALTVTNTSLPSGQITISTTNTTLATLGSGIHRWYLKWINPSTIDRKVLAGKFELVT